MRDKTFYQMSPSEFACDDVKSKTENHMSEPDNLRPGFVEHASVGVANTNDHLPNEVNYNDDDMAEKQEKAPQSSSSTGQRHPYFRKQTPFRRRTTLKSEPVTQVKTKMVHK